MTEEKNIPVQKPEVGPDSYRDQNTDLNRKDNAQHFPEDSHSPKPEHMETHAYIYTKFPGKNGTIICLNF